MPDNHPISGDHPASGKVFSRRKPVRQTARQTGPQQVGPPQVGPPQFGQGIVWSLLAAGLAACGGGGGGGGGGGPVVSGGVGPKEPAKNPDAPPGSAPAAPPGDNVLDETPTFTLPKGLTASAGETVFADDEIKRLSATTTETAGSAADRVVEFQESPTNGHANVEIAPGGALTLTGTPAAGTINVNWQWKYAGQPDTAWQDGAAFDITVNAAPQPVQPSQPAGPALSDFNQVDGRGTQGTRGSSLELLPGTGARDLFFIDTVATGEGGSDLVTGFVQSKAARLDGLGDNAQILGDILRFRDDSAPADATAINLYTALLDSSGSGDDANDLYIYETQGNTNAVLAIMLDVGIGFVLTNDDVWEDATIVAFEV